MARDSPASPAESETKEWKVIPEQEGDRLDRHVAEVLAVPRNQVHHWIADGRVSVNQKAAKPSTRVQVGDRVVARPPPRLEERVKPEAGTLQVLYEDPAIVVLDKAAGVAVHPGAGRDTGTLAHHLLHRYPEIAGVGGPGRPGIVHRLDQGTSGVMVVARTADAYRHLSRAFATREVEKRYLAMIYGRPSPTGTIDAPIGRHRHRRKEMAVIASGKAARTDYETVEAKEGIALLSILLATGRTHQIRVHLKSRGWPLIGDPTYGEARWKGLPKAVQKPLERFSRPALHAWRLAFEHPEDQRLLTFEAPIPEDLSDLWRAVTGENLPSVA